MSLTRAEVKSSAVVRSGIPAADPAGASGTPPAVSCCGAPGCSAAGAADGTRQMAAPVWRSPEECLQAENQREQT